MSTMIGEKPSRISEIQSSRPGWPRHKERLDKEEAHAKFLEKEEVKWARLAQRAFHRKVPAEKVGNRTEVGWWPHMKQEQGPYYFGKETDKEAGQAGRRQGQCKIRRLDGPLAQALLGKAERCQTLMVDGLPDRDVCRSMDTLKRLWTKGAGQGAVHAPRCDVPPLDVPKFAMGQLDMGRLRG